MALETSADISHRARRILIGAKMRQSKDSWDELFLSADKDRSKSLDLKELNQASFQSSPTGAQFTCEDRGWSDDVCKPKGTNVTGYGLLPPSPDWIAIRKREASKQIQAMRRPQKGKTLVIFHNGHGMSKGCPTYGDTDGSVDWLNQMGFDVATIMMPFKDCNSNPSDPPSLHAWFKMFEDKKLPWLRYFLEPVINTINFAISSLSYERIIMMGLSGGGWTTTLAAAVDPRIVLSIPIAGSLPCDFRHTSWDFEQFCSDRWAQIGNYTALYVLAALESHRTSAQMLHEADPCCYHACGRHLRIQEYNQYVRSNVHGLFQTIVTQGNQHQVNPRDKAIAASLIEKIVRQEGIMATDLCSAFNLLSDETPSTCLV
ncbi:cysK [Symbiodinium pilosum]|uniref:CysK protein n=1 Tax=Symbiodinium pilosum TaxID=2952 RepID=A0A812WJK8_SYMPI|nr:cysK [Symbiodinium pilosum]